MKTIACALIFISTVVGAANGLRAASDDIQHKDRGLVLIADFLNQKAAGAYPMGIPGSAAYGVDNLRLIISELLLPRIQEKITGKINRDNTNADILAVYNTLCGRLIPRYNEYAVLNQNKGIIVLSEFPQENAYMRVSWGMGSAEQAHPDTMKSQRSKTLKVSPDEIEYVVKIIEQLERAGPLYPKDEKLIVTSEETHDRVLEDQKQQVKSAHKAHINKLATMQANLKKLLKELDA